MLVLIRINLDFFLQVIYDRITGKSRGFGFVTMSTVEEVEAAARQFNGYVSIFIDAELLFILYFCVLCDKYTGTHSGSGRKYNVICSYNMR